METILISAIYAIHKGKAKTRVYHIQSIVKKYLDLMVSCQKVFDVLSRHLCERGNAEILHISLLIKLTFITSKSYWDGRWPLPKEGKIRSKSTNRLYRIFQSFVTAHAAILPRHAYLKLNISSWSHTFTNRPRSLIFTWRLTVFVETNSMSQSSPPFKTLSSGSTVIGVFSRYRLQY